MWELETREERCEVMWSSGYGMALGQWLPVQDWVHQHSIVDKDGACEAPPVSGELAAVVAVALPSPQELPTGAHKQARAGREESRRGLVGREETKRMCVCVCVYNTCVCMYCHSMGVELP